MSHQLYQTEGFVLGAREQSEASADVDLFTEKLGLITARAQGVRLLKSKLRYHLEPFSLANVNLIRGREVWRLVGAEKLPAQNFLTSHRPLLASVCQLLGRLAPPEVENEALFFELKQSLSEACLLNNEEGRNNLRLRLAALILTRFGYGDPELLAVADPRELAELVGRSLDFSQL